MHTTTKKTDYTDEMLEKHTTLVKKIAHQLKSKLPASVELDDLIQAGTIGLLDAISKYKENHGAQFETYASQRIRGSMLDELRSADWLPRSVRKNMREVETATAQTEQMLSRAPCVNEVAKSLSLSLDSYYEKLARCSGYQLVYYEDFHDSENRGDHFLDRFAQDNMSNPLQSLLESGFKEAIADAIEHLPERERNLMVLYYEQEMNLKEIGSVISVSESRVCQLHNQTVRRVRATLKEKAWIEA